MKVNNRHINYILFVIFLFSYFLPVFQDKVGDNIYGYELFILHLISIVFIEDSIEYIRFLFEFSVIIWVILLFVWTLRGYIHYVKVLIISLLSVISAFSWIFVLENNNGFQYGYWIWAISIFFLSVNSFTNSLKINKK